MDTPSMQGELRKAAFSPQQRSLRRQVAAEIVGALTNLGGRLQIEGHTLGPGRVQGTSPRGNGDDRSVAVGYLARAAGQLLSGVTALVDSTQVYAASALSRQLVEVEYLLWAFATDHDDAATWINSVAAERRAMWQPRHLRERSGGRFLAKDYSLHCEFGGHPTPGGLTTLLGTSAELAGELALTDSMRHAAACRRSAADFAGGEPRNLDLDKHIEHWLAADELPHAMQRAMKRPAADL